MGTRPYAHRERGSRCPTGPDGVRQVWRANLQGALPFPLVPRHDDSDRLAAAHHTLSAATVRALTIPDRLSASRQTFKCCQGPDNRHRDPHHSAPFVVLSGHSGGGVGGGYTRRVKLREDRGTGSRSGAAACSTGQIFCSRSERVTRIQKRLSASPLFWGGLRVRESIALEVTLPGKYVRS